MSVCACPRRSFSYCGLFDKKLRTGPTQGLDAPQRQEIDRPADRIVRGQVQAIRMGAAPSRRLGSARLGSARLGSARLGSARLGSARLGSARLGSARLGSARLGSARLGSARLGSARLGSARLGSARLGSARLGSARLGSARLGSARLGSAIVNADSGQHVKTCDEYSSKLRLPNFARLTTCLMLPIKPCTHLIAPTSARSPPKSACCASSPDRNPASSPRNAATSSLVANSPWPERVAEATASACA